MWSFLANILLGAIKWIWGAKQQAQGEAQGQAEQAMADQNVEMRNEANAQAARQRAALSSGVLLVDPNNDGPASRR